jgi:uncharacterized membrane protein YraQ (UPF0718 family)
MDVVTIGLLGLTLPLTGLTFIKRRAQSRTAFAKAKSMMAGMVPDIIAIIFLIGMGLSLLTPERIAGLLKSAGSFGGTILAALTGCITLIPAFVAFPLVGDLIRGGAELMPAVAFLTTLTMVGIKTIPLEAKEFGLKFTLIRSSLSFLLAIGIAMIMGVLA